MLKNEQYTILLELLKKQKELTKKLKNTVGKYYELKIIADELNKVEEELWNKKVFCEEDITTLLKEKTNSIRNCERIYYFVNFLKEDEEERHENYFHLYGKYLIYVPPFYQNKDYILYYNLAGGSKLVDINKREKFERDNYIIIGKKPTIIYQNISEYNKLMQPHNDGYNEIEEDYFKYQMEYNSLSSQLGKIDASKQTYLKYNKKILTNKS